jgi:uncharacterized membrane protein YebE (DUF533 family)
MSQINVEILKTILALAQADGTVDERETRLIDFLIDSYGLSPEEEQAVRAQTGASVDLERLAAVVTEPKDRARAYEVACLLAGMDDDESSSESALLEKLRPTLDIKASEAEAIAAKARKILAAFKARQAEPDA